MDPLSPSRTTPAWPDSPDTPYSSTQTQTPIRSSTHATSPLPTSSSISSFREPKVFGAPPPMLVSPPASAVGESSSGSHGHGPDHVHQSHGSQDGSVDQAAQQRPFLRVRIGGLERNRKDMLVRFDASTNLPHFRTTLYRNMQRTYAEFQRFTEQASLTSPHTIIPALPLASTSAMTDAEDDRLVRIALQRWFSRICEDPALMRDDELRSFIESEFSYNPIPPPSARRPVSASSSATNVFTSALSKVIKRGPMDEDEELASAKGALEKLEGTWGSVATNVNTLGKARRAHAMAMTEVGAKMVSLSTVESDIQLASAVRKVGRAYEQLANLEGSQAVSENVILSDSLGYQALNARAAKDALLHRTQVLEDSQTATRSAINKRRNVEKLRGASNISAIRVDDAIAEMEEANALETQLQGRLDAISKHLHVALRTHSRHAHEDVALALLENARLTVGFHKHALRELEALQPDFARIGTTGQAAANTTTTSAVRSQLPTSPSVPSIMGGGPSSVTSPPHAHSSQSPPHGAYAPDGMPRRSASSQGYRPAPGMGQQPAQRQVDGTQSMFLPPGRAQSPYQPSSAGPMNGQGTPGAPGQMGPGGPGGPGGPLGNGTGGGMTQSVMLPGQAQYAQQQGGYPGQRGAQTMGRGPRRLDDRQAAKLLAGGF